MDWKKMIQCVLLILGFSLYVHGEVPLPRLHKPNVPNLYQFMGFQTMQMKVFSPSAMGMVPDAYTDLIWNPAFVCQNKKSAYLDFYTPGISNRTSPSYIEFNDYFLGSEIVPDWYSQSNVETMETTPQYHIGLILPLGSGWTLGFLNQSIFDYGPYRSSIVWDNDRGPGSAEDFGGEYEPQRIEVDENQQKVLGTQSEILLGYRMSEKLDLGLRLGQYVFSRPGDLYNSRWAVYPHSSDAELNDESLDIKGQHYELGLGILYHLDEKTQVGAYGSYLFGESTEDIISIDTSYSWWERDVDPDYYSIYKYNLESGDAFTSDGKRPTFTLTFDKVLGQKWKLRSYLSGTWLNTDLSGSVASSDTTYGDRTYDDWEWNMAHFKRQESHSSRLYNFHGNGEEKVYLWKWFLSLIYQPGDQWALFGGIQIQKYGFEQSMEETSFYRSHDWTQYTYFEPGVYENRYLYDLMYSYSSCFDQWKLFLPIGIKAEIKKGFYVLLGTDVTITYTHNESESERLFPRVINQRWENRSLRVDDEEINRYEIFASKPADTFDRTLSHRFGLVYEHSSGAKLYIRTYGDIFQSANWAFGFEFNW